jgi:hypothetical protein
MRVGSAECVRPVWQMAGWKRRERHALLRERLNRWRPLARGQTLFVQDDA